MRLRLILPAWCGIFFVLFVALSGVWGSVERGQIRDDMQVLYALGMTPADFCGETSDSHDHCPLCRLVDDAPALSPDLSCVTRLPRPDPAPHPHAKDTALAQLPTGHPARAPPVSDKSPSA